MTIIRFTQSYSRGLLLYNPGEEAGFIDVEAAALVEAGVAVLVRRVISAVPRIQYVVHSYSAEEVSCEARIESRSPHVDKH